MTAKTKILIISLVFGMVLLLLAFLAVSPILRGIGAASGNLIALKKSSVFSQDESGRISVMKDSYRRISADIQKIEALFVDAEAPIDLIKFFEKTAQDFGLLIRISPLTLKETEGDPWKSIAFQFNLIGSFPYVLRFLEKIENSSYLIEVQSLRADNLGEDNNSLPGHERFSASDIEAFLTVKVFSK